MRRHKSLGVAGVRRLRPILSSTAPFISGTAARSFVNLLHFFSVAFTAGSRQ